MSKFRSSKRVRLLAVTALFTASLAAVAATNVPAAHAAAGIALDLPVPAGLHVRANGPHSDGTSPVRNAVDIGPIDGSDLMSVHAAASGTVVAVESGDGWSRCRVKIQHADEWVTRYQHLMNVPAWVVPGAHVDAGQVIGYAGDPVQETCGTGGPRHVHFSVLHHGDPVAIDGTSIGGYTVHAGSSNYYGWWTDDDTGATVVPYTNEMTGDLHNDEQHSSASARESGTAVVSDDSGRVWSFAIKQDGTLMYRFTNSTGWDTWRTVGTGYQSVAATIDASGRVWTAVTMQDGALKFRRTNNPATAADSGSGWGSWSGEQGAGNWVNLSANADADGRVWMFATKTNGDLYYKHQDDSFGWSLGFVEVGNGGWRSVSSAVESDTEREWMFATKTNGDLYYRYTDPSELDGWADLTLASGGWAGDVAATGDNSGQIWMFGAKANGDLLYRHTDTTGWTTYSTVGNGGWASVSAGVKPDSTADGQEWMFATKTNGDLFYNHTDTSPDYWTSLAEVGNGGWK